MDERENGYRKPPTHSRFKKGTSGNPKGRPKAQRTEVAEVIKTVMEAAVEYREGGRIKTASRRELAIRSYLKKAVKGDVGAADALLRIRALAQEKSAGSTQLIRICDLLPGDDSPLKGAGVVPTCKK